MNGQFVTHETLAAAFREWQRQYNEDPDSFFEEWWTKAGTDYGEACASYFESLLLKAPAVSSVE